MVTHSSENTISVNYVQPEEINDALLWFCFVCKPYNMIALICHSILLLY